MTERQASRTALLLQDRVIFISGAASGIGKATALACIIAGARALVLVDVQVPPLKELQETAEAQGVQTLIQEMSVSNEEAVKNVIDQAVTKFGRLDAAFNNAGIEGCRAAVAESSTLNFDRVLNTNTKGVYLCMKYELQQFLRQTIEEQKKNSAESKRQKVVERRPSNNFAIVNCASTAGLSGMPEFSAYCASKHAIIGLTKSAALEYARQGIRINALCPSTTDTPMVQRFQAAWPEWQAKQNASIPVGRIGTAEEMANAVVWMLSDQCTYMTGHCMVMDGGGMC